MISQLPAEARFMAVRFEERRQDEQPQDELAERRVRKASSPAEVAAFLGVPLRGGGE